MISVVAVLVFSIFRKSLGNSPYFDIKSARLRYVELVSPVFFESTVHRKTDVSECGEWLFLWMRFFSSRSFESSDLVAGDALLV